jgi:hypothetical protein
VSASPTQAPVLVLHSPLAHSPARQARQLSEVWSQIGAVAPVQSEALPGRHAAHAPLAAEQNGRSAKREHELSSTHGSQT